MYLNAQGIGVDQAHWPNPLTTYAKENSADIIFTTADIFTFCGKT
jgi:hypothetical protein